ncbi:hypothetical protein NMG60_11006274 [Bertholletia excelsa]
MDSEDAFQASGPDAGFYTAEPEAQLTNVDLVEGTLSGEDMAQVVRTAGEILTRIELNLSSSSEKLLNLDVLMMHVATRESDLEAFLSDIENVSCDSASKAMEFDLLSVILDSEVREFNNFMSTLKTEIIHAHDSISSCKHLGLAFEEMEDKLHRSEESMLQLLDQLSEIMVQTDKFQKIQSSFGKSEKGTDILGSGELLDQNAKIKMQTAEQQRNFLRMLEKSLARELDLEKQVGESRQIEEELKFRLHSLEQEVLFLEEEADRVWERLFEAENTAEVLMGTSKEILCRLQIAHFNLNGSIKREENMTSELQNSVEKLKDKDIYIQELEHKLAIADSEALTLRERVISLEKQYEICEKEKVNSLERQLRESDIQLQHALASSEASLEKQNMLYSTIHDMENLIEDLKSRVSKTESRAESAEEKCVILSKANSSLNEELSFLMSRLEFLESSLHRADETKMATVKDIGIRTKVITNLVMQLAIERERLHKQISSLMKENKILSRQVVGDPFRTSGHEGTGNEHDLGSATCVTAPEKEDKNLNNESVGETESEPARSTSNIETVRNIDAWQLSFKHVFVAVLILVISALAAFWFQHLQSQFWWCL